VSPGPAAGLTVPDTALGTVFQRAEESIRRRPLFRDPFGADLAGPQVRDIGRNHGRQLGHHRPGAGVRRPAPVGDPQAPRGSRPRSRSGSRRAALPPRPAARPALDRARLAADHRIQGTRAGGPPAALPAGTTQRRHRGRSPSRTALRPGGLQAGADPHRGRPPLPSGGGRQGPGEWREQPAHLGWWLLDVANPLSVEWGRRGTAALDLWRFTPDAGVDFFRPLGWEPEEVRSAWLEARRLRRQSLVMRVAWALTQGAATGSGRSRPTRSCEGPSWPAEDREAAIDGCCAGALESRSSVDAGGEDERDLVSGCDVRSEKADLRARHLALPSLAAQLHAGLVEAAEHVCTACR
jgi:hypothetical protein